MDKVAIKNRIQKNIITTSVASVLFASLTIGGVSYFTAKDELQREIECRLSYITNSTHNLILTWIEDRITDHKAWSQSAGIEAYLNGDDGGYGSPEKLAEDFVRLKETYGWYEDINFFLPDKGLIASALPKDPIAFNEVVLADEPEASTTESSEVPGEPGNGISEILESPYTGHPVFVLTFSVTGEDGSTEFTLLSAVDVQRFTAKFIDPIQVGVNGFVFLYQSNGLYFAHPDNEKILKEGITDYDWGETVLENKKGIITVPYEGQPQLINYYFDESRGIGIAAVIPLVEVNAPVKRLQRNTILITLIIILIFSGITYFLSNYYILPLKKIIVALYDISEGEANLTKRLEEKGNNEITQLGMYFNSFVAGLMNIVRNIQTVSMEIENVRENLALRTEESVSSSDQITVNIENIKQEITRLDGLITRSAQAISNISTIIEEFDANTTKQSASVFESSSAIEEMHAAIQNVGKVTQLKEEAIQKLIEVSQDGSEQMDNTNTLIQEINDQVDNLFQTNTIINKIASQTSLLSMNAAIEAAHAGEAGRGFAIVAEEIRNLAEGASQNAKNIGVELKKMINQIKIASESSIESKRTFSLVTEEISDVSNALAEISASVRELTMGSAGIIAAMDVLNKLSVSVKDGSEKIHEESGKIDNSMKEITDISENVVRDIKEISIETGQVNNFVQQIQQESEKLKNNTERLNEDIKRFIV